MRRKSVSKSSCPISNGERPPALAFSGGNADCAFHKNAQTPGNIACPYWHGNFDIMPIFGICQGEAQYEKFAWVAQRPTQQVGSVTEEHTLRRSNTRNV